MKKIVVATKNKGKLTEIKEIFKNKGLDFEISSLKDECIDAEVIENGSTFKENAFIKALEIYKKTNTYVLADDSGIEIDFLNGSPGIFSARFCGEDTISQEKNQKILKLLQGIPYEYRTARFTCALAFFYPNGKSISALGHCEGYINEEPQGENGFGYDPIFYIPNYDKTMAELDSSIKNKISHRAVALNLLVEKIKNGEE